MTCPRSRSALRSIAFTTPKLRGTRRAGWSRNGSTTTWCATTAVPPPDATAPELHQSRADQREGPCDRGKADRRTISREHLAFAAYRMTALRQAKPHEADGLFRAAAARSGDTGDRHGDVGMRALLCALGQLLRDQFT